MVMSDQELKDLVASLAVAQAKTDAQIARTDAQLAKTDAQLAKTEAQVIQTGKQVEQLVKTVANNDRAFRSLNANFQGFQSNQSLIDEYKFQRAFALEMSFKGIKYDEIKFNWKAERKGKAVELDIVLINGSKVLIVEVKRKPHTENIKQLLKQKEAFPIVFDDYENYDIEMALAGDVIYDDLIEIAKAHKVSLVTSKANGLEILA